MLSSLILTLSLVAAFVSGAPSHLVPTPALSKRAPAQVITKCTVPNTAALTFVRCIFALRWRLIPEIIRTMVLMCICALSAIGEEFSANHAMLLDLATMSVRPSRLLVDSEHSFSVRTSSLNLDRHP